MSHPYLLNISNLTVYYKNEEEPALEDFELNINNNCIIVIAGNSGSGKSTLAKSILRLLPKGSTYSGSIIINNEKIENINKANLLEKIGFLPQFPMDYVLNLLVSDEISFPLENLGYSKDDISIKINQVLKKLNISHLKYRLVTEISSGELQKVTLATAIAPSPSILLLDEPFARMDSTSELHIINILKELKKHSVIIILEHHLDYILEIADVIILLNKGKIIAQGTPFEVLPFLQDNRPEISKILIPPTSNNFTSYSSVLANLKIYLQNKTS